MKTKFISGDKVVELIKDRDTVATVGMTLVGSSEKVYRAIENSFLQSGHPRDLTLVHSAGQSDRENGIQHFAHQGLVKRIVGSHWGLQPRWMEMIRENKVEAYCLPQGQIAHLYRAMSHGNPGKLSKIGLHTFIDPRLEGGKMNSRTQPLEDLVEVVQFRGEEFLFYKAIPLDVVIFRGTTADENGNITTEEEAMKLEILPAVLAAKRYGGKVICQVKRVAQAGTLHPKQVVVPGVFVDAIVVADNPEIDHRQTHSTVFDPAYSGDLRVPLAALEPWPHDIRKVVGRRAVMTLKRGSIINLGTGIPNDTIGKILAEEGLAEDIMVTVESGVYGGIPEGGVDFGIAKNNQALITHYEQFDFYNGRGVDYTFMGVGEIGPNGDVNSSKFGDRVAGAGGFIDITQGARNVVFCSTFTAKGLRVAFDNGKLVIEREGSARKFVNQVAQVSFSADFARRKGQNVYYVTERALFELADEGIVLKEIAPGVDLHREILGQMDFKPIIDPGLKTMDERIFIDAPMGLVL